MSARLALRLALLLALLAATPRLAGADSAKAAPKPLKNPDRREIGLLPAVSFSTDIGLGLGAVASWTRFARGKAPFKYRIEALFLFTLKQSESGIISPYHSDYLQIDVPGLFGGRVRINAEAAFRRFSNIGYYGLGNAAGNDNPYEGVDALAAERHFRYVRTYPSLTARARIALDSDKRWQALLGAAVTYNAFSPCDGDTPCPDTKLERDKQARADDRELERALRGTDDHLLPTLIVGLIYDSRDHNFSPRRGAFHEISLRGAPRPGLFFGNVNITLRAFHPIFSWLTFAWRAMADLLFGQVPFYMLARYGGLSPDYALGGSNGVRGVPLGRYHGRMKFFGNFELRARFVSFSLFGASFRFGATAFVDVGRVFTDYRSIERLDGSGDGIKAAIGGGLRLLWGEAFVIRADVGWSPDAEPIGIYVVVGQAF
ncbi:MAG: BamA/TamA family outer membrane protein [Myxococcales bacterium]|nr:BamA/TamA family outer membrane protein [Myxococcales bacterium]